jgi:SNF2 family DNA or RNA helicase
MDISKLKLKPVVKPHDKVGVIVGEGQSADIVEEVNIKGITFTDARDKEEAKIDLNELKERLQKNKLSRVSVKRPPPKTEDEGQAEAVATKIVIPKKKAKKVDKKTLIMQEDGEETVPVVSKKRATPKVERGVAELGPEEWVEIGDLRRLPVRSAPVNIKVSSYYMNNRQIFVNFINSLFDPYKKEVEDVTKNISCDSLGQGMEDFSLLTHQKIVRDYMNLYTPYRGLLLYHGLGSGKTCTSIALAEGMKSGKRVIVMTPASLRRNYMEELKKCGDLMYKKNQYWEWIDDPDVFETLSSILSLSMEWIEKREGAWLVNVKKKSNYAELTGPQKKNLDEQLDEMIRAKYTFINYNGLRASRLREMTSNYEKNIFDNSVVIIDEAHNFISRIVNKLKREKDIPENARGEKDYLPQAMSLKLYEYLMSAQNTRVVLLTGTPIINYPNEIAILFNILRGYIKTWEIPLDVKTSAKITSETLVKALEGEKTLDYLEYSATSKKLMLTKNPLGFKNKLKEKGGYQGVSGEIKDKGTGKGTDKGKVVLAGQDDYISDDDFEKRVIGLLRKMEIEVNTAGIRIHNYKALPDKFDAFLTRFIDMETKTTKNIESFKRRIIGLTSYFRSAQEDLLPRYEKTPEYLHVVKIPMSDYQFGVYESERKKERELEKSSKSKQGQFDKDGIYKESASTYRIFSRCACNFVMPNPPGRPKPRETEEDVNLSIEELVEKEEKGAAKGTGAVKGTGTVDEEENEALEEDTEDVLNKIGDSGYQARLTNAIKEIKEGADAYLSKEGLATYSPKFLNILENILDSEYKGLHLVYSQFRTLEGIGLLAMTLEHNGFAQFKIKKNSSGSWEMNMTEEDQGKPTFALYTGTETAEEKEVIRNIYNGNWDSLAPSFTAHLKEIANNNNMGEIIKVLMITSSGSEGINLKNTRYVHIMEPYWNPVRTEQVIGRARRICSHKDLPMELQTVEVFIYLMTFTKKQIDDEASINLKNNDLSKREPKVPLTSDETLYEISSIKEELSSQLTKAIKETSIDCAVYSKNNKEGLQCISFGEPKKSDFAYNPAIEQDQVDTVAVINKKKIEWKAKSVKIYGVEYAGRKMKENYYKIYDLASYRKVEETGQGEPILVGTLEITADGKKIFNTLITGS